MKAAIRTQLRKSPFAYGMLLKRYRALAPVSDLLCWQIQRKILKSLAHKDSVFFVQVGSNDGVQGDPLHDLITSNKHWRGIFIEPVRFIFDRLKQNYGNSERFIFENKAISSKRGVSEFYYVSEKAKLELGDSLPDWYDQLGSFDKNHIIKQLYGILEPYIISEEIKAVHLQDIFQKYSVTEIDLLHIDTEGYDFQVLSSLDFSKYKPSVIMYEYKNLSGAERKSAESLLKKVGYSYTRYCGDTLAIAKD